MLKAIALQVLLAMLVAGVSGLISSVSLRRGFAVVGSVMALIVLTGIVTAIQDIASDEGDASRSRSPGLLSPWSLYNGLANAWDAGVDTPMPVDGAWVAGVRLVVAVLLAAACLARPGRPLPEGGVAMSTLVLDSASRWFGNVVAVNDVSLSIGPGVTGLLGPNGAGKTTLMAMMSGFLAPSAGNVTLDGEPVIIAIRGGLAGAVGAEQPGHAGADGE